ncbi:MAG: RluA family pseudouridine synthase [Spirochaetales bacterium]|nr:RluA family pseudouridine synthase [Spirochaetales bacterium]
MPVFEIEVDNGIDSVRIDKYVSENLGLLSRSQIKQRVTNVEVNGKKAKLSRKISAGDSIRLVYTDPPPLDLVPEKMDLDILFENEDVIVLNKPQGLVVHPGSGNFTGTLANGLVHYCRTLSNAFGPEWLRPGIVHRLDKDTSGVIITAKHPPSHEWLASQFKERLTEKIYLAVLLGTLPQQEGTIRTRIARDPGNRKKFCVASRGGKPAETRYVTLSAVEQYCCVQLFPKTGRTHQLRVHMAHLGCPILGDPIYGKGENPFPGTTLMLHAYSLTIRLQKNGERKTFTAPLPGRFAGIFTKTGIDPANIP